MKKLLLLYSLLFVLPQLHAQENIPYKNVARERADNIVKVLDIQEVQKKEQIRNIIANQYMALNELHSNRELDIKKNEQQRIQITKSTDKKVSGLHDKFVKNLDKLLNQKQVEEVKNGMTYHTVPLTYANYLLMLPDLSEEDRKVIYAFLTEAREHAMDAGTSKGKHAWFNKYKGKIANHLSAKGYRLKEAGEDWATRRNPSSPALEVFESNRIMSALKNLDTTKHVSVRNLIAYQYQQISKIQRTKTQRIEAVSAMQISKEEKEAQNQIAWEESMIQLTKQKSSFLNQMSVFLDKDQIETVKNEMTGQGLKKEYNRFVALLPSLKDEHKAKVYDYLVEARENAMNVLTSRERNQWFAKYRGRANNYLSKQGYDLRAATEALEKKQLSP